MARKDNRPAFQWYPKDYLTNESVALMTLEEEGAYRRLLDYCWLHETLPNSVERLAPLCKCDSGRMALLWPAIEVCFYVDPEDGNRLRNRRLDEERAKQDSHREKKSEAGKAGAKARWADGGNGTANVLPMANDGSSFASSSSNKEKITKRKSDLPQGWEPHDAHRKKADVLSLDVDEEAAAFRDNHGSKGNQFLDWDLAFHTWLRNSVKFGNGVKPGSEPGALARPNVQGWSPDL